MPNIVYIVEFAFTEKGAFEDKRHALLMCM